MKDLSLIMKSLWKEWIQNFKISAVEIEKYSIKSNWDFMEYFYYRLLTASPKTFPIESCITRLALLSAEVELLLIKIRFLPLK